MNFLSRIIELYQKYKLYLFIDIIVIITYLFITLSNPNLGKFNTDELWPWSIASDLNLIEIIKIMRYELHTFLWFYILKPFTYFPQLYPHIVKFLNLIFIYAAMYILYFKAPFNKFLKILMLFSNPFLLRFPVEGRCYSLGLMLLFMLAVLYKDRLKKPVLYSVIIFLAANSNLVTGAGAFGFTCLFLWDLVQSYIVKQKEYYKVIIPALILLFCAILIYVQWHNPVMFDFLSLQDRKDSLPWVFPFFYFLYKYPIVVNYSYLVFYVITPISILIFLFTERTKSIPYIIFSIPTIVLLHLIFRYIYPGHYTHLYFIYVYIIIIYWIYIENNKETYKNKIAYKAYSVMLLAITIAFTSGVKDNRYWFDEEWEYTNSIKQIEEIIPKGSQVIMYINNSQGIVPYLKNYYDLRTPSGAKIPSFEAYRNIFHEKFIQPSEIKVQNDNVFFLTSSRYLASYHVDIGLSENEYNQINGIYIVYKLKPSEK